MRPRAGAWLYPSGYQPVPLPTSESNWNRPQPASLYSPNGRRRLVSLIVSANEGQGRPFLIEPFCVNPSTRANLADRLERHQEHDAGVRASHSTQRPLDRRQWCQLADVNRNNDDPD